MNIQKKIFLERNGNVPKQNQRGPFEGKNVSITTKRAVAFSLLIRLPKNFEN